MLINVEADELAMDLPHDPNIVVLDGRETEYTDGHIKDTQNIPLDEMTDVASIAGFEDNQNLYAHCAGWLPQRNCSIFIKTVGIHNLRNVLGGWNAIKEQRKLKRKR